jgi:hypothetical protein
LAFSVIGALALALGGSGLALASQTGDYSVFVGSALSAAPARATFEGSLADLAHAAFPWSAAAPLGLALVTQRADQPWPARAAVNAAALGLGLSLAAAGWLSGYVGNLVPPGVCCLAVLLAVALAEVEIGRLGSPLLGMTVAVLSIVIGLDLRTFPALAHRSARASRRLGGVSLRARPRARLGPDAAALRAPRIHGGAPHLARALER